jgi:hypothetical protein
MYYASVRNHREAYVRCWEITCFASRAWNNERCYLRQKLPPLSLKRSHQVQFHSSPHHRNMIDNYVLQNVGTSESLIP